MRTRIPQRIVQTGKNIEQSLRHRSMMSSLRALNPDFEYLFFDNEAVAKFIGQEFPQHRKMFESFEFNIQRYDFFRYLAIYRYGGFYFDLDVLLASGLSGLLATGCVFPFEGLTFSKYLREHYGLDWQLGNYAFGASPRHPLLERVIENCIKAQRDPGWVAPMMRGAPFLSRQDFLVLNTTGPGLLSRTLAESGDLANEVTVLFPADVCDVGSWNCFGELGVHLMDGSWRSANGFLRRRLMQIWEVRMMKRLIEKSRKQGKTRQIVTPDAGRSAAAEP